MNKQTDKKRRQKRKLEKLLLKGIKSGEATPLVKDDFEAIKSRGLKRLAARAANYPTHPPNQSFN